MDNLRCKDPTKAGLAEVGKHCSDLIVLWSACFPASGMLKYYLHTVVHHAGQWQQYLLREHRMCLGMFENSAFEKCHFVGRLSYAKGQCMGHNVQQKNPSIFATLRHILKWQYGLDLASYNQARRQEGLVFFWLPRLH